MANEVYKLEISSQSSEDQRITSEINVKFFEINKSVDYFLSIAKKLSADNSEYTQIVIESTKKKYFGNINLGSISRENKNLAINDYVYEGTLNFLRGLAGSLTTSEGSKEVSLELDLAKRRIDRSIRKVKRHNGDNVMSTVEGFSQIDEYLGTKILELVEKKRKNYYLFSFEDKTIEFPHKDNSTPHEYMVQNTYKPSGENTRELRWEFQN